MKITVEIRLEKEAHESSETIEATWERKFSDTLAEIIVTRIATVSLVELNAMDATTKCTHRTLHI